MTFGDRLGVASGAEFSGRVVVPLEQMQRSNVLVVGDVMLDRYWFGNADRISPEAPVPVVHVQRTEERLGGAANVACNIVGLGARASLICVIGCDEPGARIMSLLEESKVNVLAERDESIATIIKLRILARQQQLLRADFEEPPAKEILLAGLSRFEERVQDVSVVLLSDYAKGGLTHVSRMIEIAREHGKSVLIDPKGADWERYRGASLITPNRAELREVIGQWRTNDELRERVQQLREQFALKALLLTRSEEGMTLYSDDGELHVPARAREVFDVSGAGDTVIATIAAMIGAGVPLPNAVEYANRAAGVVVGRIGTSPINYNELFATEA
ncbi:D-glycero-beta-D-manno-heptose-7-phosphate kinase [Burkholderia territorii]|uniref:D-glycero-beta-D-manno-heptose-7-phosphate kinase n=1 Tax=Burkholderia territorii TaxID=1503055 RepID=UPI0009BD481E|nr:D-glycero-beta-D-manno-heptose-7-phosphate kinase [Burkholderia territorii]TXG24441.1 D-glycero-beta-D-manno-heptose-7-phosphate kinase [Burkholderia territorii]HDR8857325.1 D-glycero-beta-D-manno-heptose-7-phosphate kinase [Burkholderia territorii]HDR8863969.1 D-glycero-beta-D-manno-heptose-7-phosphate kinase [Burkholderia territorii]HDR8868703.1 D-glycero-beta-D-manno-heptose-7-phosphate kinase [Burkholderia territorii]HDR8875262.1 D-glycero-beta-D-manno-heptose-7-phosphate kinase [Burkho